MWFFSVNRLKIQCFLAEFVLNVDQGNGFDDSLFLRTDGTLTTEINTLKSIKQYYGCVEIKNKMIVTEGTVTEMQYFHSVNEHLRS